MRRFLPVLAIAFLAGCTSPSGILPPHDNRGSTPTGLRAVGARDTAGAPTGDIRIIDAADHVQAQGRFQGGKMDRRWTFFNSHQIKVAEITYQHGVATGPYKTYFGSEFNPSVAGKLESTGFFENGRVDGEHIAYSGTGHAFSRATFKAGHLQHNEMLPEDAATKTAAADEEFARFLERAVHSAVQ